ncbi:MAG: 3',5'-cyclic-nucleotide phosphodiesterase [Nitrospiraceae bacterium]|nr:MAG: 3',5'-cyclic-nucleotide phosphodiesterase [Nitrospiraceae bacterium]
MKIQVLGCSSAELPNANLPGFLVDGKILLDAGTIGTVLTESQQWKISHVLITHAHLDHVKDLPFFADNISMNRKRHQVTIMSIPEVNGALKKNLLNDILWPDFTKIPTPDDPILKLQNIQPGVSFTLDGYRIIGYEVRHTVPAVGYLIEDKNGKRLLYAGDAGPDNTIWEFIPGKLDGIIVEVSLPNRFQERALETGHLTPKLLQKELKRMKDLPDMIFITHCKPGYREKIQEELQSLHMGSITMLTDGARFEL